MVLFRGPKLALSTHVIYNNHVTPASGGLMVSTGDLLTCTYPPNMNIVHTHNFQINILKKLLDAYFVKARNLTYAW